jgi:hypothetical protein
MARRLLHAGTDLYSDNDALTDEHRNVHATADAFGYDGHVHSNRDNRPYRGTHVHLNAEGGPDFHTLSVAVPTD